MNGARILRYARRRAELSQRALASKTGIAQPAIARIERGAVSPTLDTLQRLLAATGTTLEAIPRIGEGVDRTLIRASLERSAEQRIQAAGAAARNLTVFLHATRHGSRS